MIGHNKIIKWVDFLEKDKKKKKKMNMLTVFTG